MIGDSLSLILLPTLACNADCSYCFEEKSGESLSPDRLRVLIEKTLDFMVEWDMESLTIYWQGGEVMTLPPEWFERAHGIIDRAAHDRSRQVRYFLQSNMIGYTESWGRLLGELFGNSVSTSMDFPNLYRKIGGGTPEDFSETWLRNVAEARAAGIQVGLIAIPSEATLELGAERFYSHFADELGIIDFQVNTPFAAGPPNVTKQDYPLDPGRLGGFLTDLADIWADHGIDEGVKVGPFDALLTHMLDGEGELPCIWRPNCANEFVCIDPRGHVAQCDCWVAGYPEFTFGNIFGPLSLSEILQESAARRRFLERPGVLVRREDCIDCEHLALCHGGCPIRAYSARGSLVGKDPYCETYRSLFSHMEHMASRLAPRLGQGGPRSPVPDC